MFQKKVYDLEVFPNFFSVTFIDVDTNETDSFYIFEDHNDLEKLVKYITENNLYLIGYNNGSYDDPILNYILDKIHGKDLTTEEITKQLFELSGVIINRGRSAIVKHLKWYFKKPYKSLDLMLIWRFHKLGIGLKQVAISLKHHKIQDLPLPYDHIVKKEEVPLILKYNINDCDITLKLFKATLPEIRLRQSIGKQYNVDVMNSSRPNIADKLMNKFYSEKSGRDYFEFKDLRDNQIEVALKDVIWEGHKFETDVMKNTLAKLKETKVIAEKGKKDLHVKILLNECLHEMAKGGLHSKMPPNIYEETDEYELLDLDFGSFYPGIMIILGIYPPQLGKEFLEVLKMVTEQRLEAKKNKDSVTSDALKIVINSIYGKLGFEYGYLYSPKSMYSVTVNGQLILLKLIEKLELEGIECFYSNTDGATFKVKKDKINKFYKISEEYSKEIGIPIEFAKYKRCIIRDVNNYIIEKDNDTKVKGTFVPDIQLDKGYDMPVVAKAVYEYFINGTPVRETIENHKDIYDFCKAQKVGDQFYIEYHELVDNKLKVTKLQKNNRYYVSNGTSKLYKINKENNGRNDLVAGFTVQLFNDYFEDYPQPNYDYYVHEANKLIMPFEKKQLKLF